MYYFKLRLHNNSVLVDTNLQAVSMEGYTAYIFGALNSAFDDKYEFAKRNHGVTVVNSADVVELINDPFCSIPIYIYSANGELIIDSCFENFKQYPLTIDDVGCYENLMYYSSLYDRTPFSEVKQMPAASKMTYSYAERTASISSYWDYNIPCRGMISEDEAVELTWNTLSNIYSKYSSVNALMGVSGGLDSRLSLLLLKNVSKPKTIKTFTFGHSAIIKDYTIAKNICKKIGVEPPFFYKITDKTYRNAMTIPTKTAGGVGVNHGHIYDVVSSIDLDEYTLISNYFSDGVMGYDCRPNDTNDYKNCDFYKTFLKNEYNAPTNVLDEIENDLKKIVNRRANKDNYSGYNEYIYLTERNPKFHMKMSYLYSEILDVVMPFAEYSLLESVISLPLDYRYYKSIEQMILKNHIGDFDDISSTRYAGLDEQESSIFKKLHFNFGFYVMRTINILNSGFKILSNGYIQIPNPYITENYLAMFDRVFSNEKREADAILRELLDLKFDSNPLTKRNIRTADATAGFEMLSLALLIRDFTSNQ